MVFKKRSQNSAIIYTLSFTRSISCPLSAVTIYAFSGCESSACLGQCLDETKAKIVSSQYYWTLQPKLPPSIWSLAIIISSNIPNRHDGYLSHENAGLEAQLLVCQTNTRTRFQLVLSNYRKQSFFSFFFFSKVCTFRSVRSGSWYARRIFNHSNSISWRWIGSCCMKKTWTMVCPWRNSFTVLHHTPQTNLEW